MKHTLSVITGRTGICLHFTPLIEMFFSILHYQFIRTILTGTIITISFQQNGFLTTYNLNFTSLNLNA